MAITIKRAYEEAREQDGMRVLVDRYWPRGLSKEKAAVDSWLKELAPSADLISWFDHKRDRWDEFKRRYWEELDQGEVGSELDDLRKKGRSGRVTLVYGARDEEHNNAVALQGYLSR